MKPKQVRRNLTKTAPSPQSQTSAIGRTRVIDPAELPGFFYGGKLVFANAGSKLRLPVFEITTSILWPRYERGDLLQLDLETDVRVRDGITPGKLVVAKIRGCSDAILGRISIQYGKDPLIHILPEGGIQPDLGWNKHSLFEFLHPVMGLIRIEDSAWCRARAQAKPKRNRK